MAENHSGATPASSGGGKKNKGKKPAEPVDIGKELLQTITNIENKQAGDRENDQEIDRDVKKSYRETLNDLKSYETERKKLDFLLEKYKELLYNMKRLDRDYRSTKKKSDAACKERDTQKAEIRKLKSDNEKLDDLTKEFRAKQRKYMQEKEKESRKSSVLQSHMEHLTNAVETLKEQQEVKQPAAQSNKLDEKLKLKFMSFIDQYELRELHFRSMLRQFELQRNYHLSLLDQYRRKQSLLAGEAMPKLRGGSIAVAQPITTMVVTQPQQLNTATTTESELRTQLNMYVDKFRQVEETLNSSNDLFTTFRKEMEDMSRKTKRLEKENATLHRKSETINQGMAKVVEEKGRLLKDNEALRSRNEKLERLSRALQSRSRCLQHQQQHRQQTNGSTHHGAASAAVTKARPKSKFEPETDETASSSGLDNEQVEDVEDETVEPVGDHVTQDAQALLMVDSVVGPLCKAHAGA